MEESWQFRPSAVTKIDGYQSICIKLVFTTQANNDIEKQNNELRIAIQSALPKGYPTLTHANAGQTGLADVNRLEYVVVSSKSKGN